MGGQSQEWAKRDTEDSEEKLGKRNSPMSSQVRTEGERDVAPGPGTEIPPQPVERTMLE